MARARVAAVLAVFAATLAGASGPATAPPASKDERRPRTRVARPTGDVAGVTGDAGFRLSEGRAPDERPAPVARPQAERLASEDARRLLERLPPLAAEPDVQPFAQREGPLPPPRTGRSVVAPPFPPPSGADRPEAQTAGPLAVLRRQPEGDVALAPRLSVTFSQPMVALDAARAVSPSELPIRLDPQPPGEWRWVGTRTLLFEPEGRFAMASRFRAEVPSGVRSATGGTLARAESWSFETGAPRLVARHPEKEVARRDALLVAVFDQRVDPRAVLATIELRAGGSLRRLRLASSEEVALDAAAARLLRESDPGRVVAFRAEQPLPAASDVEVRVGPGTPSAEGPRVSAEAESWRFETYGPFRVVSSRCGRNASCAPDQPWQVRVSNPVDPKTIARAAVRVEPELPGLVLEGGGQTLWVRGRPRARTSYAVRLSSELRDAFGQPLEGGAPLRFEVGAAQPMLFAPGEDFVVLDPRAAPALAVYSTGHAALRVLAYAVAPSDWPAWHAYRQKSWRDEAAVPPGRRVLDERVAVAGDPDALSETRLPLERALDGRLGQLAVVVTPETPTPETRRQVVRAWVQATRIGLDAFSDERSLAAWVTALEDGRPLPDVELELGTSRARSGADGLARIELGEAPAALLVARLGADVAILPQSASWWAEGTGWRRAPREDQLRFFVFADRGLYRPGEELRLKGWLRRVAAGPRGDVEPAPQTIRALRVALRDSQGNELPPRRVPVGEASGFEAAITLPKTFNLGPATVEITAEGSPLAGSTHVHVFQVQEFRRPEFEVKTEASASPYVSGDAATVSVSAAYYAGGALPGAEVSWNVSAQPAFYRPPGRDDFVFGPFMPWWLERPMAPGKVQSLDYRARTDAAGLHRLRIDFDAEAPPRPRLVTAEATVADVNRQAWSARSSLLVHPALDYVGLRAERPFVERGREIAFDVIATDLDGAALAGRAVRLSVERLEWQQVEGEWKEIGQDAQRRELHTAAEPVRASFAAGEGGVYRVLASVSDRAGRENETELRIWVAGGRVPPRRDLEQQPVTLVPDRREYAAGDTARVLVVPPFAPAEGVLTLRRSGLVREERFRIAAGSHTLAIPIEEAHTPNVHVQVDLVGQAEDVATPSSAGTAAKPRPAFASGSLVLAVPPRGRTLALGVKPRQAALPPGGETVLELTLQDADSRPVADAEAAVMVVDEAVLALTGYRLPDPHGVFYAARAADVQDQRLRAYLRLSAQEPPALSATDAVAEGAVARQAVAFDALPAPAAAMVAPEARLAGSPDSAPIAVRADFAPLALFAGSVRFDASGRAALPVKLKDNLTRYRVMAVAASGARRFGSGEATLTARLPLMVRPSPPRFLSFGDRFELPVVVQNETESEMSVDVAVRARNAALTDGDGRRILVAANDRAELRFPMAAERPGTALIQVAAASRGGSDAATIELPVWTPATTEAFAAYGEIDEAALVQPVRAPEGARAEIGGLELTTSSTALHALTDAVLYLAAYPFECAEQLSSRVLAISALRDVLAAFAADGLPQPEALRAAVDRDLARLRALQADDGGFGFWRRDEPSWPYVSIHVAHALARAKAKGFAVPDDTLERSRSYLREIDRRIPEEYGRNVRRTLRAYALYTRALLGDPDPVGALALVRDGGVEALSFEALGFALPLLAKDAGARAELAAVRRRIANGVEETAGAAHFTVDYSDGAHLLLHSDRRADAILLDALIADQPRSDLVPKLVAGLLAHRKAGRWSNTQENVFVLLALDRYFGAYEKATPDFVARAWLGERYAGSHTFQGRTTERQHTLIPMRVLAQAKDEAALLLAKEGQGRLYYRVGLRYAPRDLTLGPLDRGFTVERAYEGVDAKDDVRRDAGGAWRIRAGARVRVRLTMVAPARRYHVALVDPLPAGLEALNPALATTGALPEAGGSEVSPLAAPGLARPGLFGRWWWWPRPWFEHQNLRDERVEAFSSLLWEGVHAYRYVARATTPGRFVVAPPRAEEMYSPETFGRGASDVVIVE